MERNTVRTKWNEFIASLVYMQPKFASVEIVEDLLHTIFIKYGENHRFYHSIEHIIHMLDKIDEIGAHSGLSKKDSTILKAATWYHDIYYDPFNFHPRLSNEFFSGAIANVELGELGLNTENFAFIDNVRYLITLTQSHEPRPYLNIDINTQHIFIDADMSILGETSEKYEEYSEQITDEYFSNSLLVTPLFFYKKRSEFLRKTLANKPIFYTSYMRDQYEEQACTNIRNEIDNLDKLIEIELTK